VPDTVVPVAGAEIATVGAVTSELEIVTETDAVVLFPAASLAIAESVYVPFACDVVLNEYVYGVAVSSLPRFDPFSWNCTPTTPILSDAVAVIATVPDTVAPVAGAEIATVGAVTSELEIVTETDAVVLFPAASLAIAEIVYVPFACEVVLNEYVYGEAVTSLPRFDPFNWNCTPATPILSDAVAVMATEPDTVAPVAGAEIATVGAVTSELEIVTDTDAVDLFPAASLATAEIVYVPFACEVVLNEYVYGVAVSSLPRFDPFNWN
jgi:hypothetical protein